MRRAAWTLALAASAFAALLVPAAGGKPADTGTVIVSARDAGVLPAGARFVSELGPGLRVYVLNVPAGSSAERYSDRLARRSGVYAAQPNTRMRLDALASPCADPPDINASQNLATGVSALAVQAPGPTAPIAILDTGVDTSVPELTGRVRTGSYTIDDTTDTSDIDGHGTEVAAVAAAKAGRFRGISPTTPIIPIKIYNKNSETTVDWVVKGIEAAVKAGAPFINLSSSNPAADVAAADANVLQQAITAAFAKGTITIVSAGNEGKGNATVPGQLERVINVGSANTEGTRDAFSNFGPWVDLVSPGASLILPAPPGVCTSGYGTASGTSFSAPAVAGAAALIKSLRPTLDTQQMYDLLRMFSIKDVNASGRSNDLGFGLLSVEAGVNAAAPPKQSTEIDDDVYWLKQDTEHHPTYLKATSKTTLKASLQPGKDPDDVFPVYVKKYQLLTATATATKSTGLLSVGIWSKNTGSFDVSNDKTGSLLVDSEGVTNNPRVQYRVKSTGTYYVSVDAPDAAGDDKTESTVVEPYMKYSLSLNKGKAKKPAKKKRKKKKKK